VKKLIKVLENRRMSQFASHKIGEFIEACELEMVDGNKELAAQTNRYRYNLRIRRNKRIEQRCLKQISFDLVFTSPAVQQLEYKAQVIVAQLFRVLKENYLCAESRKQHLLNEDIERMFGKAESIGNGARLLCDHISGMSDDYVIRTYRRLIDPEFGSIVDLV